MLLSTHNLFLEQSAPCHKRPPKKYSVIVILKLKAAAFQNILELYHDQRVRKHCVNLDYKVLLPQ